MSTKKTIDPIADDNAAANMIRSRINEIYSQFDDSDKKPTEEEHGLIDLFWHHHHSHPNPHKAWSDYYENLSEKDKHRLWQEYHLKTGDLSGVPLNHSEVPKSSTPVRPPEEAPVAPRPMVSDVRERIESKAVHHQKHSLMRSFFKNHVWPVISAALIVMFVWLVFNNELVVAKVKQYISPGSSNLTPVIIDPSIEVSKEPRVIVPKINVDVPVVYDIDGYNETAIQNGLKDGVVHYGNTAAPGEIGNAVYVGHSSNNFFNSGKYKFAFVLLNRLEVGDTFILNYKGTRYVYRVTLRKIIEADNFTYIQPTDTPVATLITCDPPGTSWKRLVIRGEQITPDPAKATKTTEKMIEPETQVIPGNAPSLWDRVRNFIF